MRIEIPPIFVLALIIFFAAKGCENLADKQAEIQRKEEQASELKRNAQADLVRKGLAEWRTHPSTGEVRLVRVTNSTKDGAK